jgi:hypothetical protein
MIMELLQPTLHRPVPLQTRVRIPQDYLGYEATGTVAGIASIHVVFQYIVILDTPHPSDYGVNTAITVGGPQLMNERGEYEWRLES